MYWRPDIRNFMFCPEYFKWILTHNHNMTVSKQIGPMEDAPYMALDCGVG